MTRKDWRWLPLQSICDINPKMGNGAPQPDTLVSFVPMAAVAEQGGGIKQAETRPYGEVAKGYTYFRENDVLFAKITPCMENGKITIARGLANGIGFGSTEFHVIRCGPDVLPEWVFAFVSQPAFRAAAKESFTGTAGQQRVPADFVKNSAIPLPPLPEQERLVRLLDEADALRRLRARADARMADFTPALFHEMFGDPARNEKGWPIFKFGEVCECRLGKMLDAKQQTGQQKRPYLRNVNVQWGRFDLSEVLEMDFDEKSRELLRLRVGDILICEGGEVGRCAIWHDELPECYFQKALHRARPNSKLANSEYILWFMWSLAKSDGLSDFTTQSTIAHLTGVKLNSLPVPLPPLALQHEFAARVMEARALEEKQAQSKARLEALFESMLARAFAGEL